jgi:hypothetical protein
MWANVNGPSLAPQFVDSLKYPRRMNCIMPWRDSVLYLIVELSLMPVNAVSFWLGNLNRSKEFNECMAYSTPDRKRENAGSA